MPNLTPCTINVSFVELRPTVETIAEFLAAEHRQCDEIFTLAEEAAHNGDLASCRTLFQQFQAAMERHFQKEEVMLFPAFEDVSATPWGRRG